MSMASSISDANISTFQNGGRPLGTTSTVHPEYTHTLIDETEDKSNGWEVCLEYARSHVDGQITVWKDEVDNLLIFAGLFSGVVASFAIESYQNLQQDPAAQTVVLLEKILALQLNATNPQPNLPTSLDSEVGIAPADRRVNIYFFLSLILSLSAVVAGILCLQWLREYARNVDEIPAPHRHQLLEIHVMRSKGISNWRVPEILSLLPLILLLSLLLFFVGLVELLLMVDTTAAIVASVMVGITSAFVFITTVLPALQSSVIRWSSSQHSSQCPYKSPQAWIIYRFIGAPLHLALSSVISFSKSVLATLTASEATVTPREAEEGQTSSKDFTPIFLTNDWSGFDLLVYQRPTATKVIEGLQWLGRMFLNHRRFAEALYRCTQDESIQSSLYAIVPEEAMSKAKDSDRDHPGHLKDVVSFHALSRLVENIDRGQAAVLLDRRLDLFTKIKRVDPTQDIDCPLVTMSNASLISRNRRQDLLQCICKLIEDNELINESQLTAIEHILGLESDALDPNIRLFEESQRALQVWLTHNEQSQFEIPGNAAHTYLKERVTKLERRVHLLLRIVRNRY